MFLIAYEHLVVVAAATNSETDLAIRNKISNAQVLTVFSSCIYQIIYFVHMLGINAASSVVSIQVGYCVSDVISECGVGIMICQSTCGITIALYPKCAHTCAGNLVRHLFEIAR